MREARALMLSHTPAFLCATAKRQKSEVVGNQPSFSDQLQGSNTGMQQMQAHMAHGQIAHGQMVPMPTGQTMTQPQDGLNRRLTQLPGSDPHAVSAAANNGGHAAVGAAAGGVPSPKLASEGLLNISRVSFLNLQSLQEDTESGDGYAHHATESQHCFTNKPLDTTHTNAPPVTTAPVISTDLAITSNNNGTNATRATVTFTIFCSNHSFICFASQLTTQLSCNF
jgi:hypothetical protein